MQQFHRIGQAYPELRPATARTHDFSEIYQSYAASKAAEQASRCLQCGVPFCSVHCPLGNNIPDWLRLTAGGFLREAYEASAATNTFPEICGRICPQDRLCEGNCVVNKGFGAITIGSVEKFLTDNAWEQGWVQPFPPEQTLPYSIGIIGSGPAGMAAAEQLRRAGCEVHLYDRYDRAGGLMIYGIPHFKLDKSIVLARHTQYAESGVQFHFGADIGQDIAFGELRARHDAILIATGVYAARGFEPMPGVMLPGVVPAMDYLTASNRKCLGDDVTEISASGKHVVVIGGGDTAMDCVRTAIRQDAASVTCLYRRDRENMPGSQREVNHAIEEGVRFRFLSAPTAFLGTGRIEAVRVKPMRLGPPDRSGRREPIMSDEPEETMAADMVIPALGYDAENMPQLFAEPQLQVSERGTLAVDAAFATSVPGVFAAGDIVRGASLVVWAIAEGRAAAGHMLDYLHTTRVAA
jgi:glutamate synthase (NADPH/NADH) small chain